MHSWGSPGRQSRGTAQKGEQEKEREGVRERGIEQQEKEREGVRERGNKRGREGGRN